MMLHRPVLRALFFVTALVGAMPVRADTAAGLRDFQAGRFSEAVQAWVEAAERSDADAALYLGVIYDTGFSVPRSPAEALHWYRRSGMNGNATGMLNTGIMLDVGQGTAADPAGAAEWYRRAADAGSGRAAFNLGLLYEGGIGLPTDRGKARRFFRQALANGVEGARAHLVALGERQAGPVGRAVPDTAMLLFQQAQRVLLTRGPKADSEAAALFRQAADAGNALAAYNLAYCYEYGIGVTTNVDQALMWYQRSASGTTDPALRAIATSGAQNLLAGVDHVQR